MRMNDPVTELKGIGPKKEKILNKAGIYTLGDLINFFPSSYEDRRKKVPIKDASPGESCLVEAEVISVRMPGSHYSRKTPLIISVRDKSAHMDAVFFGAGFLRNSFKVGETYVFYGKISEDAAKKEMIHPDFTKKGSQYDVRGVFPKYPDLEGISQKEMRRWQKMLLPLMESADEWLPKALIEENNLASSSFAIKKMHFPSEGREVLQARYRLVFEEILLLETGLLYMKSKYGREGTGIIIDCKSADRFAENLPFNLTEGQKESWKEIRSDLMSTKRMNRLLQGDVGSGKTVIAEMAMLAAASSGYQSVIMAPTEILARQHYETFKRDLPEPICKVSLLTGSIGNSKKKEILTGLCDGTINILVSTHAAIEDKVKFNALGLAITDEQHRFGVNQRKMLSAKGKGTNILVMTATPIPRTLGLILYGDLDISQIRTMPEGRKPVKTYAVSSEERESVYRFVEKEIENGGRAYIVAPLIEKSEQIDARSVDEIYNETVRRFPSFNISLLHGEMKAEEKEKVMEAFARGAVDILVSTVVIEVGVDISDATVMVIESAERFGLAQLHQLRGRVGRGRDTSYCFLITEGKTEQAAKRVRIMESTSDGFILAEEDLKMRGPGDFLGDRQHGLPELKHADLIKHGDLFAKILKSAEGILRSDPNLTTLENRGLRERMESMFGSDLKIEL